MRRKHTLVIIIYLITVCAFISAESKSDIYGYTIVDTGQNDFFNNNRTVTKIKKGSPFYGQDAGYNGNQPSYKDNGDGTVTDLNTGLIWQSDPGSKVTLGEAIAGAKSFKLGGFTDWRLPTIKELYSLIQFSGIDVDPRSTDTSKLKPFIDTEYFDFKYGDVNNGERIFDSQFATSTKYVSTTMRGDETMFGVNFADGRIKGYGLTDPRTRQKKKFHVLYVRGNSSYGINNFIDNGDGTITDRATGLMWMTIDSGKLKAGENKDGRLNWQEALKWSEDLDYAGHSDWRLPDIKELQSIVDYSRSPDTSKSAAIDTKFETTSIVNANGIKDYPYFWSSTTHISSRSADAAAYISFGRAMGWMRDQRRGETTLLDVHGAGAQRSDPKSGDPSEFPKGRGPQGDVINIYNYVRCVRNI